VRARSIRGALADDPSAGAGNVLAKLAEHGADPAGPGITFDTAVDGYPAWTPLTLGQLRERVAARASWLHARGVGPRDPVAVYVTSAADCLLTFMAMTWLGAIPALMNGNLPGDVAAAFIRRLDCRGVLTDPAHRALLAGRDLGVPVLADASQAGAGDGAAAPPHYRHHGDDPVAITHSSGTTRLPAAVVHTHDSLFAATRLVHLATPRVTQAERTLCVLPAAHAAGIISTQQALCNRHELLYLSAQGGGQSGRSGSAVLEAIERWHPTGVYGFAVTWAELARFDLAQRDTGSVALWFNTGDCAHETHVRRLVAAGSHLEMTRAGVVRVPGSKFIDGIGSTEMGHSAFRAVHKPGTSRYGRCVGKPYDFAEIALLDPGTGVPVPDGQVGHAGLKAPTLAPGYWNDSAATYRSRLNGYYLTGDLMYRDADGYYYHVDRAADAVELGGGHWLYTALSEERILASCPDVRDCTVVASRAGDMVLTDVLLLLAAGADPDASRQAAVAGALGEPAAATLRRIVAMPDDELEVGPTGKVRKFLMRQRHLTGPGPQ
jgi:acyl-coenzyme A synthetase/AMP-(fatty) acid ligase